MQATIPVSALRTLAKMANTVAQANSAVPSHGYVHLEAKIKSGAMTRDRNPRLVVQAFDGDIHWIASDGGGISSVQTPGVAVVRADQFHRLVSALGAHDVELDLDGAHLVVRSGRSRNRLTVLPPAEFPAMDLKLTPGTHRGQVQAHHLQRVLRALGGVCSDESKAIINCLRLGSASDGEIEASATDGYRAGQVIFPGGIGSHPILLSARQRQVIVSYIAGLSDEDEIDLACDGRIIAISKGQANFIHCRMMAEADKFPPVAKTIPTEHLASVEISRDEAKAAVGRALLVAKDQTTSNRLYLSSTQEGLKLEASTQMGFADEEVTGEWSGSLSWVVALNGAFLLDALTHMPERVRLGFSAQNKPILIEGLVGDDEPPLRMVLMPIANKR